MTGFLVQGHILYIYMTFFMVLLLYRLHIKLYEWWYLRCKFYISFLGSSIPLVLSRVLLAAPSKTQHNGHDWVWWRVIYSFEEATAVGEEQEWSTLRRKCWIRSIVFAFAWRKLQSLNGSIVWWLYDTGHLISPRAESQEPCGWCGTWLEAISPGALL